MSETSSIPAGSPVSTTGSSSVREENPTPSITVSSGASALEHLNQMNLNDPVPDHTPDGATLPNVTPANVAVVSTIVSSGGLLQEDTEMEDAPVANEPEGLEATGTNKSTATATSSKKSDPVNALKKLIYRRDRFFSLMADMVTTDSADPKAKQHLRELREQINDMNKDISSVMKHSLRLSLEKVTSNSNESVNETNGNAKIASVAGAGGIRLNRHDLPKFQLKTSNQKYFPKEESFESVNHHFLRSFEKEVSSSGEDINVVWKRYIPLTLHYDLDACLRDELLVCPSWWSAASSMFVKKFGNNAVLKLQSRREVFSAAMKVNETTDEYSVRFKKAGYSADNSTIGDAFLMGFPKEWQSQINTLLHCAYPDRDCWTTDEISTAALNIFNNDTINLSFVGKSRGLSSTGGDQANKGVKRAKTESYYFPNHGGTAARHSEKDCIKNKGGSSFTGNSSSNSMPQQVSKPKFLGNKNSPHSATTVNTFCTWCGKLWVMGHSCPEYFEKNKGRNVRVLTIRSAGNRKKHDKGKSKADENDKLFRENMEEDSYCEYETKS